MIEPLVYLNGGMVPASEACLPIYDAAIVQGATVTEMTRTFHQKPFRLDDHLDRLASSLRYARMDVGLTRHDLNRLSHELLAHNAQLLDAADELGIVHFVSAGEYPTYAGMSGRPVRTTPTVCIHTFRLPFELWARKMERGAHVVTPSIRHVPPQCYDPKMKCRSRMHYYLADKEAQLADPDASALLLDLDGNVTETNAANFLIVERGVIVSPTLANTLPGISRATVIELASELGIPFVERDMQISSVVNADEAFLASTPYCLMPVTKINGLPIAGGQPGPTFRRLIDAWSARVGLDVEKQIVEGGGKKTESSARE